MQNVKCFLLSIILITPFLRLKGQDLPINSETKLVSVSNIVTVKEATSKDLKQRVEDWLALRSNSFQTLFNGVQNTYTRKKHKNLPVPSFIFEKKLIQNQNVYTF